MVELDSIVIVTAAPILGQVFKGGAQCLLNDTYCALQSISRDCIVLQYDYQEHFSAKEYLTDRITDDSAVHSQHLSREGAIRLLREADLTLSVDRTLYDLPRGGRHVLYLSNLAYDAERIAVQEKCWNRIWLPSTFLRDQLVRDYSVPTEKLDVIPPVLNILFKHPHDGLTTLMRDLERDEIPLSRRLLFPHRSDPAKGIISVIGLLRRLAQDDHRWRLIVTAPSTFDDAANQSFFRQLLETTKDVRRHLKVIPWLPHNTMGNLYAMSGCTMMASTLPESFGLIAAESIACGTPVVAIEAGALSRTYCELHAVHFVDEIDSNTTAHVVRNVCGTHVSQEIISFLLSHFSKAAHVEALRSSVALLGEQSL